MNTETDEQIVERLRYRFAALEELTRAIKRGKMRSLIVSGGPGVGKSFGIEKVLAYNDLFSMIANSPSDISDKKFEIVKGSMGEIGLYKKLYEFRNDKQTLVLDDNDDVFASERSLNMLKNALDTGKKRILSWNFESNILKDEGIPNSFEYNGGIIFVTNLNFNNVRSKTMKAHLEALEDRSHVFDLTVHTARERGLRIKQVVDDGMLNKFDLSNDVKEEILKYILDNQTKIKLSLRTVSKTAELAESFPDKWQKLAKLTLKEV